MEKLKETPVYGASKKAFSAALGVPLEIGLGIMGLGLLCFVLFSKNIFQLIGAEAVVCLVWIYLRIRLRIDHNALRRDRAWRKTKAFAPTDTWGGVVLENPTNRRRGIF